MTKQGAGENARRVTRALALVMVAGGFSVLLYVNASDWWAQYQADAHITEFTNVYDNADDPVRLEYLRQAQMYNDHVAGGIAQDDLMPYPEQLFYLHEPMMSFIEIPKIHVRLPVYHGTSDSVLAAGVGHVEGTSLPVGGTSAHGVFTGHSGMYNTRMFDDLRKLDIGDVFVFWTLDDPYAYEVYDVETVLPEEAAGRLAVEEGRDLVTLITCTPYGVNSHRLLVHAQRCGYDWERVGDVGFEAYVNDRNVPLLLAMGFLATVLTASAMWRAVGRKRYEDVSHGQEG